MINDLPTIFEAVTGAAKKKVTEKSSVSNHGSTKSKSNLKRVKEILLSLFSGKHSRVYADITYSLPVFV